MDIRIHCLTLSLTKITKDVCKTPLSNISKNLALCIDNTDPASDEVEFCGYLLMNTSTQKYHNVQFQTPINVPAANSNIRSTPDSELYPFSFDFSFENKEVPRTSTAEKTGLRFFY